MTTTIAHQQQRRKTAAVWTSSNEILLASEIGVETDTGRWKLGDGSTVWAALPYQAGTAASLAAAFGPLQHVTTTTVTASGTAPVNTHVRVDATGGAVALALPTGQPEGTTVSVEKTSADSTTATITGSVRGSSGQTVSLAWANEVIGFRADSSGSWWPVSGYKKKTSLDSTYAAITETQTIGQSYEAGYVQNGLGTEVPVCEYALPSDMAPGDIYEFQVWGGALQNTGSTVAFFYRVHVGSVNAMQTGSISIPSSANSRTFLATIRIHIGVGGNAYMFGDLAFADALSSQLNPTTFSFTGKGIVTGLAAGDPVSFTAQMFNGNASTGHSGSVLRRIARASGTTTLFNGAAPVRSGVTYTLQNASRSWSTKSIAANVDRFEVRSGDTTQFDTPTGGRERAEFGNPSTFPFSTDLWVAYSLYIEPGTLSTAPYCVLGQMHQSPDAGETSWSPLFEVDLIGANLVCTTRSDTAATSGANPTGVTRWTLTNFTRGVWHNFVHRMRVEHGGTGHLASWHNGTSLFDADIPLGYNDTVGPYWKHGIYRGASPETLAVRWANVEAGTTNLTARITTPLTIAS